MINWFFSRVEKQNKKNQELTFFSAFFWAFIATAGIGILVSGVIYYWMIKRVDVEIRMAFTTSEFTFTANRDILMNSLKFQSLQVNDFSQISLYPLPSEENDPRFQAIENQEQMVITPENGEAYASVYVKNIHDEHCGPQEFPAITFPQGSQEQLYEYFLSVMSFKKKLAEKPCGKLNGFIIAQGTTITLAAHPDNKGEFNILLKQGDSKNSLSPVLVSFEEPFQLNGELVKIMLGDTQLSTEEADLKLILDEYEDPYLTIAGQSEKLELRLSIFPPAPLAIFRETNIPIATPKVFTMDETAAGEVESKTTLLTEGEISFTQYPDIKPISFKESDIVRFGEGGNFKMERIRFVPMGDAQQGGIEIRLRGTPTKLTINETFENLNDRRLTYYEKLKQDKFWQIAFDYIFWVIPLIISIMGLILIDRVKVIGQRD